MTPEQAVIAREREASPPPRTEDAQPGRKPSGPSRRRPALASDERLARRAGHGDADAFAAIFRRYERDLYRFCVGILGEPQDAQDAIQNTMLKVLRALPGEHRDLQLKPWLYRIAHNEAVELRRRQRQVEQLEAGIADAGVSVDERAERSERLRLLFHDMTNLPQRQRAALVMRELNGLEFGEIGAALGTSPSAVRQALYEARRGLQQMELGRHMDCDAVTRVLSDDEGRLRGRRDVRAHLRQCSDCRRFRCEISDRKQTLAAISPLPAFVAAGLLKSALAGWGAGGASAGAGAAGAAAGLTGGAVATSGLVKTVAGVLAVVAICTAAADRSGLVDLRGQERSTPVERDAGSVQRGSNADSGDRGDTQEAGIVQVESARAASQPRPTTSPHRQTGSADEVATRSERAATVRPGSGPGDTPPAPSGPLSVASFPLAEPEASGTHQHTSKSEGNGTADKPGRSEHSESASNTENAEAKAEKKEAKAGAKSEQAEGKTEKTEAKVENGPKPEKAPKSESKGVENSPAKSSPPSEPSGRPPHPEHPPHPEGSQKETPPPAPEPAPFEPEATEAPAPAAVSPGNGNGNGNGSTKSGAAAPSK